jgi:signal transduction histidine kinase
LGDSVSYKYQLKNFEMDWTETNYPVAKYMNLLNGNYQLTFIASQRNKEIGLYSLNIKVKKSLEEAWWFYPVLVFYALILIVGGIYLFFLYSFRQKMKLQKLRNKIAADLHDEIGSSLNSIAMSSNFIQNKLKDTLPDLHQVFSQMKADSEETVNNIRDTVWALNAANDTFETLIEKIKSFSLQLLVNKGINLIFKNNINESKAMVLNLDIRKNLILIAKEAINNIAKHSEATEAHIIFSLKKDMIYLEITDNGIGFKSTVYYEGNGLKNFRKRADESFIDLTIESEIGKGTKIILIIPVI